MSSGHTLNPTGGVQSGRGVEKPPSTSQLLERILSPENVGEAWKRVRANKGAPGIDCITVDAFPDTFRPQWSEIRATLFAEQYIPSAVLRIGIPKADGGLRPLNIPIVLDRLIQ